MPVPTMNQSSWEGSQALENQRDMTGIRQNQGARSQDDANVGYLYQRSHSDALIGGGFNNKRWTGGDDIILEQSRQVTTVQELERHFHGLAVSQSQASVRPEVGQQAKKFWDDDLHRASDDRSGVMFHHGWTTRDDTWNSGSSETSNQIGLNMVEYVLGGSPNKVEQAAMDRMKSYAHYTSHQMSPQEGNIGEDKASKTPPFEDGSGDDGKILTNGFMANVLDDGGYRGSKHTPPADEDRHSHFGMSIEHQKHHLRDAGDFLNNGQHPLTYLDSHQQPYQQFGLDPLQYGGDFGRQMIQGVESPNSYNMDYNQLLQQQQTQVAMLTPQQPYTLSGQQSLEMTSPNAITQGPYMLTQDQYVAADVPFTGQHPTSPVI